MASKMAAVMAAIDASAPKALKAVIAASADVARESLKNMPTATRLFTFIPPVIRDVIHESRLGYPISLMTLYLIHNMVLYSSQNPRNTKDSYNFTGILAKFLLSFLCYAYPAGFIVDTVIFDHSPRMMTSLPVIFCWGILFTISHQQLVTKFLSHPKLPISMKLRLNKVVNFFSPKTIQLIVKLPFLCDLMRAGLMSVEKADSVHVGTENQKRFPLVLWTTVLFISGPALIRAVFFNKTQFWKHPEGKTIFQANYQPILIACGMVGYYLYATQIYCGAGNGVVSLKDCLGKDAIPFSVVIWFTSCFIMILDMIYIHNAYAVFKAWYYGKKYKTN